MVPIRQSCCNPVDVQDLEGHFSEWERRNIRVTLGNASFMVYGLSVVYLFACFCLALVMAINLEDANYWHLANLAWGVFLFAILIRWVLRKVYPYTIS